MPLGSYTTAKDQGNRAVMYRDNAGHTFSAKVEKMSTQPTAPATPTAATATTGGTLAAGTYSYKITRIVDGTESLASAAVTQATTGSTSTVTVSWTNDPTAQAFRVYGRAGGSELLIAEVAAGSTSYVDTGAITPAGAQPGTLASNAVHLRILSRKGPYQTLLGGVLPATGLKQLNRYYAR
jgi:hypothetical protein